MTGKNRIMIYGPKNDGTYVVEFKTDAGEALAISIPRTEAAVMCRTLVRNFVRARVSLPRWSPHKPFVAHTRVPETPPCPRAGFSFGRMTLPDMPITLRQGARVIEDSRRLRVV